MVCIISFGLIDIKILIPLVGGIINFVMKIFLKNAILYKHPLIISICSSLGMCLSFIPYFIVKKRIKTKKIRIAKEEEKKQLRKKNKRILELEYNDIYEEITMDKFKYIFLISLFDYFQTILVTLCIVKIKLNLWIFNVIFVILLVYVYFPVRIYNHHKLSILIMVLSGLLIDSLSGELNNEIKSWGYILLKIIGEFLYSLIIVYYKILLEKKFSFSYEICFYMGIITFILYFITLIIFSFIYKTKAEGIFQYENDGKFYFDCLMVYYNEFNSSEFFYIFLLLIIQLIFNLSIIQTVAYFTPTHVFIIIIIGRLAPFIQEFQFNISEIVNLIPYILIVFSILVLNEIIEINCCNLQKYTKNNIRKRAIQDSDVNKSNNDDSRKPSEDSNFSSGFDFPSSGESEGIMN